MSSTVMIVDDEPSNAELFSMMLEVEGYHTIVVHGTSMAINMLHRERPDLILLDVMMPGVSGLELCRFIRREPGLAQTPVVLISAKSRPEDIQAGLDAGAQVYLVKPVSKTQLLEGIRKGLGDGPRAEFGAS